MLECFVCGNVLGDLSGLMRHMKTIHSFTSSSQFICKQGNCRRSFQSSFSFRRHVRSKHGADFAIPVARPLINNPLGELPDPANNPEAAGLDGDNIEAHNPQNIDLNEFKRLIQQSAHAYTAKLSASSKITRSQVQSIVTDTTEFLASGFVNILKDKVLPLLPHDQDNAFAVAEIESMFNALQNPFDGLETEYLRMERSVENSHLIRPQSFVIGERVVENIENGNVVLTTKSVTGQFIPLRQTLKYFFELPNVLTKTLEHMEIEFNNRNSNIISNFVQAKLWQQILASTPAPHDAEKIPLFIYFDDFEINNPLGSKTDKLGGLYYSIPVIPPEFQSKLENIFVGMLFHSEDRVTFGNRATFSILIDELTFLETEGITVITGNGPKKLSFIMSLVLGDNLGMHSLLGFVEGFRANYACRFCKVHRNEAGAQLFEDTQLVRNDLNYNIDVATDDAALTGVNARCIWNDLPSFHCVRNISCDMLHDLLEGVCKYDMAKIIFYLVYDVKLLTLETLNSRIRCFCIGSTEAKNRPSGIKKYHLQQNTMRQSASQMLCLVRFFGIMIGDLIPENNDVWKLYLTLRQIIDITTAKSLQKGCHILLGTLIAEHNEMYIELFKEPLKPKFHFLVHYPRIMDLCGPVVHMWTMRDEAKHKEGKVAAHTTTSRRDIVYTLAFKNQLKFCERLMSRKGFNSEVEIGPGHNLNEIAGLEQVDQILPNVLRVNCYSVNWARLSGIIYKKSKVILVSILDELPKFAVIQHILIDASRAVHLVILLMHTVGFVEHLHAYEVENDVQQELACIEVRALIDKFPSDKHLMADGKMYVSLRNPA